MAKTGKCLGTTQEEVLVAELVLHVGHVHQEAFCAQLVSRSPLAVSVLLDLVQALQSSLAFRPSQVFSAQVAELSFVLASSPLPFWKARSL